MNTRFLTFFFTSALVLLPVLSVVAQGTFTYDQQSVFNDNTGGEGAGILPRDQPLGQSFTPSSNAISFLRLQLSDMQPGNNVGGTVHINLRSNSMTGPIIASTLPVFMPDGFGSFGRNSTNFFFSNDISIVPSQTYFFQPIMETGSDTWAFTADVGYRYGGGTIFFNGTANSNFDLWFREGIYVVPEPSALALLAGSGVLFYVRRKKRP
jgi:hypothetical protein